MKKEEPSFFEKWDKVIKRIPLGIGKEKIDTNNAQHLTRQKAIAIMEFIAEYLGKPKLFDCKNGDTKWYDVEDKLTEIINKK